MEQETDNVVDGGQGSARQAGSQHLQNQFETTVSINDSYHCFNLNKCVVCEGEGEGGTTS